MPIEANIDLSGIPDAPDPGIDLSGIPDADFQNSQSEAKSMMGDAWKTCQEIGNVYPMAEAAMHVFSTFYAVPIAGFGAALALPSRDYEGMTKIYNTINEWLVYQPKTPRGTRLSETALYPFKKLQEGANVVGEKIMKETGNPYLATAISSIIIGAPALIGLRSLPKVIRGKIQTSTTWRQMNIKERGLVLQGLEETIRKNPEMTEGQIIRRWEGLRDEAMAKRAEGEKVVPIRKVEEVKAGVEKPVVVKPEPKPTGARETIEAKFNREVAEIVRKETDLTDAEIDVVFLGGEKAVKARIKEPWEMTKAEFEPHYEAFIGDPLIRLKMDRYISEQAGSLDTLKVFKYYQQKYPEALRDVELVLTDDPKVKKANFTVYKSGRKVINVPTKVYMGKQTFNKPSNLRHEIEHALDYHRRKEAGKPTDVLEFDFYKHERFEAEYLHRGLVKKALKEGKPVPVEVLAEYPDLRPVPIPEAAKPKTPSVDLKITKKEIREITGQIKMGALVKEEIALKAAFTKAAAAARKAISVGRKEGIAKEGARLRELAARAKARKEQTQEARKMINALKKVNTSKMEPIQAKAIERLIGNLDLTRITEKKMIRLKSTREYLQDNPSAELADHVLKSLERLDKLNISEITLDDLRDIYTAVIHQVHLAKMKREIKVGRQKRDAETTVLEAIKEMKPAKEIQSKIIDLPSYKKHGIINIGRAIKDTFGIRHDHYDLVIETLAGPNSIMDKVLFQGIKEGILKQLKYKQDAYAAFLKDLKATGLFDDLNIDKWMAEKVKVGNTHLTRGHRMALYRHSLNRQNMRHLMEGGFGNKFGEDPNLIFKLTKEDLKTVLDSLSPEEKAFARKPIDNLFEAQGKELSATFYEKNGYELPLTDDPYYPIEVMEISRGTDIDSQDALDLFKDKWVRPGVAKGMLKERVKSKKPLYLNSISYDVNKSIQKSAAYVGLELPLTNASRLLYDKTFRAELTSRYGKTTWKEIEQALRDIAGDYKSYASVEQILLKFKNKLAPAILGLNPFVMAKQVLSFPVYLPYVKGEYLIQGMLDFISHPKELSKRHQLYSPEYLERVKGGYSRDVADVFKGTAEKRLFGGKRSLSERTMGGIQLFDKMAVIPGMQGAVLQVLAEFEAGKLSDGVRIALDIKDSEIKNLTPEGKMKLAYKFADYATERTQPMFSPEHRSSLSRGAPVEKIFTMYASFTNQALNLLRRTWREYRRTKDSEAFAKMAKAFFVILVVNTMGVMAIDAIRDRIYGRESPAFLGGILRSWSGYFYFIRDLMSSVISKVERGTFMGYDVSIPISKVPELLSNAISNGVMIVTEQNASKREKAALNFFDDSLELFFLMQGLPYATPKKLIMVTTGQKKKKGKRKR